MSSADLRLWLFAGLLLAGCGETTTGTDGGFDAGTSDAGTACSIDNFQPDTCGYGNACNRDNACQEAVNDTCGNITQAISKGNYTAWTTSSTGPIIYVHQDEPDVQADCADSTSPFTVTLYAYAGPGYTFPQNKSGLSGFWYFTTTGNAVDIPINLLKADSDHYSTSNSGKNMQAKFTLCGASGSTQLQAGFAFTNGNAYCASLHK